MQWTLNIVHVKGILHVSPFDVDTMMIENELMDLMSILLMNLKFRTVPLHYRVKFHVHLDTK